MRFVLVFLGGLSGLFAQNIITTVAGTEWSFPAASMPAGQAPLGGVSGGTFNARGDYYFADTGNHVVFRLSAGVVTIVAGNGRQGLSGDGGPAISASMNEPAAVAVDAAGNLFIADARNNRIRQVFPDGTIGTFAGGAPFSTVGLRDGIPATSASLQNPRGVAVDSQGNVYIADTFNDRACKVTPSGTLNVLPLTSPGNIYAVAVDRQDNVYVGMQPEIWRVTPAGAATKIASGFSWLNSLAVDANGTIYVSERNPSTISRLGAAGKTLIAGDSQPRFAGDGGPATRASLRFPSGVAVGPNGDLYVADTENRRIRVIDGRTGVINTVAGNGRFRFSADGIPATAAVLSEPSGAVLSRAGELYISECGSNRVRKVDKAGIISTVAGNGEFSFGGDGLPATQASLRCPKGLVFDDRGNLYVADSGNSRIRRVGADGRIGTFVDLGSSNWAIPSFYLAVDLAIDAAGTLYFTDFSGAARLRKATANGTVSTVADLGQRGVTGVALDPNGGFFFADWYSATVSRLSASGAITTVADRQAGWASTTGLARDAGGNLVVADTHGGRIWSLQTPGRVTLLAGKPVSNDVLYSGDGGLATLAGIYYPMTVALAPSGSVYAVDSGNHRIRALLGTSPALAATPSSLEATVAEGTDAVLRQTIRVTSTVTGLAFSVSTDAGWLTASRPAGTAPADVELAVSAAGLRPGVYRATVTIGNPLASPASVEVGVSLTVTPAAAPKLGIGNASVALSAVQGSGPVSADVSVLNQGGGTLSYRATPASASNWLSAAPAEGTATPGQPGTLTVVANPGSLPAGTYSGAIAISAASGGSLVLPVVLSISPRTQKILLSQAGISFTAVAGGGPPGAQNFGILNEGRGALTWTARARTLTGGNWLRLAPASGRVERPLLDVSLVEVSVDSSALGAGEYYGRIEVAADADNSPQVVTVLVKVLPEGSNPGPEVRPAALIFAGLQGQTPGSQDVRIQNLTGTTVNLLSTLTNAPWLKSPGNLTVASRDSGRLLAQPDYSGLTPGVYRGLITLFNPDDGLSRTVNLLAVVAPPDAARTARRFAAGCPSTNLQVEFTSLRSNFAAVVGQPLSIETRIVDDCGRSLVPSDGAVSVLARFEKDPELRLSHVGNGNWQGTWTPLNTVSGVTVVQVWAVLVSGNTRQIGTRQLSGSVSSTGATPRVSPGGVTNAASGVAGVASPGGYVSIYGVNFAARGTESPTNPLPLSVEDTSVFIGGRQVPVRYAGPGQINALVPFDIPVNTTHQVFVQRADQQSVPENVSLAPAQPGLYTFDQGGRRAIAQNASRANQVVTPQNPARAGDVLVIYCNGLGPVEGNIPLGGAATGPARTVNQVSLTIGGREVPVAYAGLTPGIPGLYQINATVPAGVTGDSVDLVITVAGQVSPPAPISIQ